MKRFLRRAGGVKRLFFGVLAFLGIFYIAQTLILNGTSSRGTSKGFHRASATDNASVSVGRNVRPLVVSDGEKSENKAALCDVDSECPSETVVFSVRSLRMSDTEQNRPQFCVNGKIISSAPNARKAVSVVVVSGPKRSVEDVKHFDVSVDDKELRDFLIQLPRGSLVVMSSVGNVEDKLTDDTRSILRTSFGAYNDTGTGTASFVFIGQKGLESDIALEKKGLDTEKNDVELRGCLKVPMGTLEKIEPVIPADTVPPVKSDQVVRRDSITYGLSVPDCGAEKPCQEIEVAVSVYSGKNKDDEPKICVNGRMIMSRSLNKGGRGLNAVILNATTKEILRVGHFDTYAEDSSSMEVFLEEMVFGEMIVIVSFDEASTHFSTTLKQMFYELGSGLVQNLKFRASWFLVGQKGISGFSPFEELNFPSGSDWAKAVDKRICVPPFLDGLRVRPDPIVQARNVAKRLFCEKYDGYEEFCEDGHLDDPIIAAPLVNRSMNGNAIFRVPIMVVSGLSHNSLRLCLETLIRQPGIDPRQILVTYDENYAESGELAQLFHFRYKAVTASASYITQMAKSLEALWKQFPDADVAIVLEEELMVTADFLYFMAQMLPILRGDQNLHAVSAWNINGFKDSATLSSLVYRVQDFPGLAFMIRKATYLEYMEGKMDVCCAKRAWNGWNLELSNRRPQMIIPDVSRVVRRHFDGLGGIMDQTFEDIFHRQRPYSKSADTWITNSKTISSEKNYDSSLRTLVDGSVRMNTKDLLNECHQSNFTPSSARAILSMRRVNSSYVFYYDDSAQMTPQLENVLLQFRRCFGLYYSIANGIQAQNDSEVTGKEKWNSFSWTDRGTYKGLLRFSYDGIQMLLVGSNSPFYRKRSSLSLAAAIPGAANEDVRR